MFRSTLSSGLYNLPVLVLSICALVMSSDAASQVAFHQYFSAVGAGSTDRIAFRTEFTLSNESTMSIPGKLEFFDREGGAIARDVVFEWVDTDAGMATSRDNGVEFDVPPGSALIVILTPVENGQLGWAQLHTEGPISAQAGFLVALLPTDEGAPPDFEHYIRHQVKILPSSGLRQFSIPIWIFLGLQKIQPAFSVVNLAGVPADVHFTLRPGMRKTVRLGPRSQVTDYVDQFWELAFPEIFPFQTRLTASIESEAPLGVSIFNTQDGFPTASIEPTPILPAQAPKDGTLGEPVQLGIGELVSFPEQLRIGFYSVQSDNRCPTDVNCIVQGEAVIELRVMQDERSAQLTLDTATKKRVSSDGFEIELLEVLPEPISTDTILLSDYQITILVESQ